MAVRIRCKRTGRKNRPCYRIDVFDSRTRRDGRCIESVGFYDPIAKDPHRQVTLKEDRIAYWISVGAKPSLTVQGIIDRHAASKGEKKAAPVKRQKSAEELARKEEKRRMLAEQKANPPRKLTKKEQRDAKKAK